MSEGKGQFEQGFLPEVTHQDPPGREGDLPVEAIHDKLPTPDGGWQEYKAAGKLEGKKAFITGSSIHMCPCISPSLTSSNRW
jgi:hypothetical protein